MCENNNNIVKHVPYQKCPICEGSGGIHQDMTLGWKDCDVCDGKKIIPMHAIEEVFTQTHYFDPKGIKAFIKTKIKVDEKCSKCDDGILIWDGNVRTSNPPKYGYKCTKCNNIEFKDNH